MLSNRMAPSQNASPPLGRGSRVLFVFLLAAVFGGCRSTDLPPPSGNEQTGGSMVADQGADASIPTTDLSGPRDMLRPPDLAIAPSPPPSSCYQRNPGVTAVQVLVRVDEYKGLYTGRNGTHEDADVTMMAPIWVYDKNAIDTSNVSLAMLVDGTGGTGLPGEIPLMPGQVFEVEGEYIPAAKANATTKKGPAAVVHFTHSPCGYAVLNGRTYK
jgi:hypothetical protein